jgi:CsoR family transcriptional regulator, copper-sensing transcriptional repressor
MFATASLDAMPRAALLRRLRSIEGQARGIQRMLEEGRDCQATLDQFAALRAATHAVTMEALEAFALQCLRGSMESPEHIVTQLVGVVSKLTH